MLELPEVRQIVKDLKKTILGKTIVDVRGNFIDHKFTFYYGDPNQYRDQLIHQKVTGFSERNFYVEIEIGEEVLTFRDGANLRYYASRNEVPSKSKLLLEFEDGSCLNVTTSMYSFIALFKRQEGMDNEYYQIELSRVGAMDKAFTFDYFKSLMNESTLKLSAKAFLATEQRILGIGNGVVQDILFHARIHPKRKLNTLSMDEIEALYRATKDTISAMIEQHGRDTEKNIFNEKGGYVTVMSNLNYAKGCPICHGAIVKENYLGGSVYYCPHCQK